MTIAEAITLAAVCAAGAVSPGPSLAVIVRNTLTGGRRRGLITAWCHAAGVGLYAVASALGLAVVVLESPVIYSVLRFGGAGFLIVLAVQAWRSPGTRFSSEPGAAGARRARPMDGFLIALLNPKIAIWFVALFGQFVGPESTGLQAILMAIIALSVDALWYTLVAFAVTWGPALERLRRRERVINRIFGVLLVVVAMRVVLVD